MERQRMERNRLGFWHKPRGTASGTDPRDQLGDWPCDDCAEPVASVAITMFVRREHLSDRAQILRRVQGLAPAARRCGES